MAKVLVLYHSQMGNTEQMAQAVAEGANSVAGAEAVIRKAAEATIDDLLACDAVAIGSPVYMGYIAGALKDFFDRTLFPWRGSDASTKLYGAFSCSNSGGTAALEVIERIANAFQLKKSADDVNCAGSPSPEVLDQCRELGKKLASLTL